MPPFITTTTTITSRAPPPFLGSTPLHTHQTTTIHPPPLGFPLLHSRRLRRLATRNYKIRTHYRTNVTMTTLCRILSSLSPSLSFLGFRTRETHIKTQKLRLLQHSRVQLTLTHTRTHARSPASHVTLQYTHTYANSGSPYYLIA